MPERAWNPGFTPLLDSYERPEEAVPTWGQTFGAAFRMENDVVAAYDLLTRPQQKVDDTFDLVSTLRKDKISEDGWDNYLGVRNHDEYQQRRGQIEAEIADRQTLAASGGYGVLAAITAGVLSPTTLIPVAGGVSKVGTVAKAAMSVAGATVLQESALLAAQETRTKEEAALSIAASAVLGGLLGGAARYATQADLDRVGTDMATLPGKRYGSEAGAAQTPRELLNIPPGAGKFAPALGIDTVARLGPVTRGIQQSHAPKVNGQKIESAEYRAATSQFSDAGMLLEDNKKGIAAAPGGAIEDQVVQYNRHSADFVGSFSDNYNAYFFDGAPPKVGKGALILAGKSSKMSKEEFADAVTKTIWSGQVHEVNQVNQVAAKAREIFDLIHKEGQEVGIFKELEAEGGEEATKILGDVAYATRDWQPDMVNRGYNELLDILSVNFEKKLQEKFQARWLKHQEKQIKRNQLVDDLSMGQEDAVKLLGQLRQDIGIMEKQTDGVAQVDEEIAAIRVKASGEQDKAKLKKLVQERKDLIKAAGDKYPEYKLARRQLATRLHNITRSRGLTKLRQRKKLETIDKNEELAMKVMNRAVRRGQRLLKFLQSGSDKTIKKALKDFRNAFELAAKAYDTNEEKIVKLLNSDDPDTTKLLALEDVQQARGQKMNEALARLDDLKKVNMDEWRAEVQQVLDDLLEPYTDLVKRRGVREDRLLAAAEKLDPKYAMARVARLGKKIRLKDQEAAEYFRLSGGTDVDLKKGTADFKQYAKEVSQEVMDRIRQANGRLAWADIIREKRGPEYARVLDIPSIQVAKFVETDINRLMVSYVKTLAADITVARKFGSPNMKESFERLLEEERMTLENLRKVKDKDGKPLSQEGMEKAQADITKFYRQARNDLETLLMRTRHTRGVPQDPQSWAARGSRLALNINTARLMGSVVVSSVADPARWVMKYGLTGVMRDGLMPLISNYKTLKMNFREAQLAGTALDVVLHSRARQIFDVFDDTMRGSKFEKGVEWTATKIGIVGLFDYWTSAMKQFTSGLAVAKLTRSIEVVMSANPGKNELAKATQYLANKNLTPEHMKIIWQNITNGQGGGKIDDIWLPNTESWPTATPKERDALRAFRAALVSDIDDTIVTPGLERPSWMDANLPAKLLAQFKSFGMSSTFKTAMSGMQQRDMAFLNGIMISLAMGSLSYYLWARATGGKAEAEMENAGIEKWADEAISRSGVLGVFDEVQRAAQHVPYLQKVASFSGRPSTRREGGDLTEAVLGPSFDLLERAGGAVVNIDNNPASAVHNVRTMLPWQNVFYLRRGFDAMENSIVNGLNLNRGQQ